MRFLNVLQSIMERLEGAAGVKTVYGEPVKVGDKMVIPVAKVSYGFGAGTGTRKQDAGEEAGGGGGGGITVKPKGVLEITKDRTTFISFDHTRDILIAAIVGLVLRRPAHVRLKERKGLSPSL